MASACPSCHRPVDLPLGQPGAAGVATHATRDCPNCGAPLIFFSEGDFVQRWRVDVTEARRRERRAGRG